MSRPSYFPGRAAWSWALVALGLRALVIAWAAARVPPAADGAFYHVVAGRIAEGLGYTWLWPDGAVTYAAHYPIGYPALLGLGYALFGAKPVVAMWLNAALGALGTALVYQLTYDAASQSGLAQRAGFAANVAAFAVACSPSLIGYVPALMTESAVGVVLTMATWAAVASSRSSQGRPRAAWLLVSGVALGAATLLRPQSILVAPLFGGLAFWRAEPGRARLGRALGGAAVTLGVALAVCAPWTARNCERMGRCMLVSANGGWNLLIGTFPEGHGAFVPIDGPRVPAECREVFQEAEKDVCFGRAGRRRIVEAPGRYLSLIPAKLRVTFDHTAMAAEYLGNAGSLGNDERYGLGATEIVFQRLVALLGAVGVVGLGFGLGDKGSSGRRSWGLLFAAGLPFLLPNCWIGWIVLGGLGLWAFDVLPLAVLATLGVSLATLLVHAVFFGAGRYTLPLLYLGAILAGLGAGLLKQSFDSRKGAG